VGSAATIGLVMGGLAAGSSLLGSAQQQSQARAQAKAMSAQAAATRQQAELEAQKGRVEAENIDRQKSALRRDFEAAQGRNRSLLAAGNVDMTSGSALNVSIGNINRFADDIGENAYQKSLKEWETAQNVKALNYQADVYDAQSSYLKKSAGNLGTSLLTAGISGVTAGLGGYAMAGGKLTSLFGSDDLVWDRALQGWSKTVPRH